MAITTSHHPSSSQHSAASSSSYPDYHHPSSSSSYNNNMVNASVVPPPVVAEMKKHLDSSSSGSSGKTEEVKEKANPAPSRRDRDPYYGHEDVAKMAARYIISLFNCPNIPPPTNPPTPQPSLAHFIAYALHRTRLPHFVTLVALILLQRLKNRFPAARGSSGHRLFISAFMIASKVVCDDTYSNQSWTIVGQKMFTLKEMNQMEREMCGYLEWGLNASAQEVADFEEMLQREHSTAAYVAKASAYYQQKMKAGSPSAAVISAALPSASEPSTNVAIDSAVKSAQEARLIAGKPKSIRSSSSTSLSQMANALSSTSLSSAALPPPPRMDNHFPSNPYLAIPSSHGRHVEASVPQPPPQPVAQGFTQTWPPPAPIPSRTASVPSVPTFAPVLSSMQGSTLNAMPIDRSRWQQQAIVSSSANASSLPNAASHLQNGNFRYQTGTSLAASMRERMNSVSTNSSTKNAGFSGFGLRPSSSMGFSRIHSSDAVMQHSCSSMAVSPVQTNAAATWNPTSQTITSITNHPLTHLQASSASSSANSSSSSLDYLHSSTHLQIPTHSSPHPSLVNSGDTSSQSSPASQSCQTPSPTAMLPVPGGPIDVKHIQEDMSSSDSMQVGWD